MPPRLELRRLSKSFGGTQALRGVDLDVGARQELLLLSPSVLVPRLSHGSVDVWDTLAIAESVDVRRFEISEASLHDIFIRLVEDGK